MPRVASRLLPLVLAASMLLTVTILSPTQVSTWIEASIGFQPVAEPPLPAPDMQARVAAERVSRERLYEHVRYLSTGPSRVTGYPGARRAAGDVDMNKRLRAALDQPNPRAPYIKPMVLLALNTGLRRGELLSLQWQDVDFESANLTVAGTYAKNAQTRHVGLNSEAMAVLREWQGNGSDYVFGNAKGGRLGHFKRSWARIPGLAELLMSWARARAQLGFEL